MNDVICFICIVKFGRDNHLSDFHGFLVYSPAELRQKRDTFRGCFCLVIDHLIIDNRLFSAAESKCSRNQHTNNNAKSNNQLRLVRLERKYKHIINLRLSANLIYADLRRFITSFIQIAENRHDPLVRYIDHCIFTDRNRAGIDIQDSVLIFCIRDMRMTV